MTSPLKSASILPTLNATEPPRRLLSGEPRPGPNRGIPPTAPPDSTTAAAHRRVTGDYPLAGRSDTRLAGPDDGW